MKTYALLILALLVAPSAWAMDFTVKPHLAGFSVVEGRGEIVSGDAQRLMTALDNAPVDPVVGKVLSLDSPGGDVNAAFEMVAVMDRVGVTTLLDTDAVCMSACASILFVSGRFRMALKGSYLGMHTCYSTDDGTPAPHCNERMAKNAFAHGVPHGSVMAFVSLTKPQHMLLMTAEEVRCWGLDRWPDDNLEDGPNDPCVVAALRGDPLPVGPPLLQKVEP